jgi:hypothetical protein
MAKTMEKKKVMEKERRCKGKVKEENRPLVGERASWRCLKCFKSPLFPE